MKLALKLFFSSFFIGGVFILTPLANANANVTIQTTSDKAIELPYSGVSFESIRISYMSYSSYEKIIGNDSPLFGCEYKTRLYRYATERRRSSLKKEKEYFYIIIGEIGLSKFFKKSCTQVTKIIKIESEPVLTLLGAPKFVPAEWDPLKNRATNDKMPFVKWGEGHQLIVSNEGKLIKFSNLNSGKLLVEFAGDFDSTDTKR